MQSDDILKAELKQAISECERLRDENARLRLRLGETPDIRAPRAE
jgi:regulator of replication initiation timing